MHPRVHHSLAENAACFPAQFAAIESNVGFRKFQLKPYALLFTDLEEVMIIDADNTPIKDPAFLFDDKEYRKVGSLFWPDYWKTHPENPIWQLTGIAMVSARPPQTTPPLRALACVVMQGHACGHAAGGDRRKERECV